MAGDDEEQKPNDLRFTSREDQGVSIQRDLSRQGHLARGSSSNMSNLRFSVRAQPRDHRDPELEALRTGTEDTKAAPPSDPPPPAPSVAAEAPHAPSTPAAPLPEPPAPSPGVFAAIKRLFS